MSIFLCFHNVLMFSLSEAGGSGDPHIFTFDGNSYTFNGRGEYTMVTVVTAYNDTFILQARTSIPSSSGISTYHWYLSEFPSANFNLSSKFRRKHQRMQYSLSPNNDISCDKHTKFFISAQSYQSNYYQSTFYDDQIIYYSSWIFAADVMYAMLNIPSYRNGLVQGFPTLGSGPIAG